MSEIKPVKRVHFDDNCLAQVVGYSYGKDETVVPPKRTWMEIIKERTLIKQKRREDDYYIFEEDPEFQELEELTKKLTKLNEQLIKQQ